MRSGSHVQLAALRIRDLELQTTSPFSNHGSVERLTACFRHKNVLQFCWVFQKFPFFLCHPVHKDCYRLIRHHARLQSRSVVLMGKPALVAILPRQDMFSFGQQRLPRLSFYTQIRFKGVSITPVSDRRSSWELEAITPER